MNTPPHWRAGARASRPHRLLATSFIQSACPHWFVDNFLRPILVGKDTKMPGYVVLISTLGGIATFGLNGFVIGPVVAAMFIATWDIFSA